MMKDLKMAIQEKHYYHWVATNGHVDAVNVKRNPFQATQLCNHDRATSYD